MTQSQRLCVQLIVFLSIVPCRYSVAGHAIYDDLPWAEDHCTLLVARVVDDGDGVNNADNIGGNSWAMLEPLAILAGNLDPSATRLLNVTFYHGPGTAHIFTLPPKGATIMAVVSEGKFIISDSCTFMPDDSPLVVINGLGDKSVLETIDRLRKVRLAPAATQSTIPKEKD